MAHHTLYICLRPLCMAARAPRVAKAKVPERDAFAVEEGEGEEPGGGKMTPLAAVLATLKRRKAGDNGVRVVWCASVRARPSTVFRRLTDAPTSGGRTDVVRRVATICWGGRGLLLFDVCMRVPACASFVRSHDRRHYSTHFEFFVSSISSSSIRIFGAPSRCRAPCRVTMALRPWSPAFCCIPSPHPRLRVNLPSWRGR